MLQSDNFLIKTLYKDNFKYPKILFGLTCIYFCFFYQLDTMNLVDWDEARVAKSSYEMSKNNNFIVVIYDGQPDFWSTKPSLLHVIQSLFIKCFGLSVLSVRLPSAICGFMLSGVLYFFIRRLLQNDLLAFLSVLIFITAPAVIADNHSFRSADYDALLVFTSFTASVFTFLFFDTSKTKYLYYFFIFLLLGVLCKGIAGLFYIPGIAIYALYKKQVISLLKNKHFYFSLLCFIVPVITYLFIRESLTPGYLSALNNNEILGRYHNTQDFSSNEDGGNFWFNYEYIIRSRFNYFYFLIPCGFIIGFLSKNKTIKNISIYAMLLATSAFFIISVASGKNIWYDLPIYPYIAILTAICVFYVVDFLSNINFNSAISSTNLIPYLFLFIVFVFPFSNAVSIANEPLMTRYKEYGYNNVIQDYIKQHWVNNNDILALPKDIGLTQSQKFYIDLAKEDYVNLRVKKGPFNVGEKLIIAHKELQQEIENTYNYKLINQYREINVYRLISKR